MSVLSGPGVSDHLQDLPWSTPLGTACLSLTEIRSGMKTPHLHTVIEQFDALPMEEKEVVAGIIRKAYAEAAREALADRVKAAKRNLKVGKVRKGGAAELRKDVDP